ncbi:MAG: hypothetical protein BWY78_01096 [Alphaproteobacteria bacterium ADurb.Bin438]|nr:MAG: hypothetical protein BWY78_01096 [Alphaproteobacteria bacterium ADurb.Bin438]
MASSFKGNQEASLEELMNDEVTVDLMKSDKVTCDDLIQIITSAKIKLSQ